MRKCFLLLISWLFFSVLSAQVKLCLDSTLKQAYIKRYGFYDGLMCVPFFCDPFCTSYKKNDTIGLCGKFVFVDTGFRVKVRPGFEIPCYFEPRFSEGLCAVSIDNKIAYIDTTGKVVLKTDLLSCSSGKNRVHGFKNGFAKVYKGSGGIRNIYDIYYIDIKGKRQPQTVMVKVKLKPKPVLVVNEPKIPEDTSKAVTRPVFTMPVFELPRTLPKGKYPITKEQADMMLSSIPHKDNRMLIYFDCGPYQLENMSDDDTVYCGKFVFTDSAFNVKISGRFSLPCGFEPEFSEGLCAVSKDGYLVYIDTNGMVRVNTGLKSCDTIVNKASTFRNGIATLYIGDKSVKGLYTTIAINTNGERVRLLEFDELELAELKVGLFKNLTLEECANCFVGKGKTNGIWFLIEKSGKVRKKLELKPQ